MQLMYIYTIKNFRKEIGLFNKNFTSFNKFNHIFSLYCKEMTYFSIMSGIEYIR